MKRLYSYTDIQKRLFQLGLFPYKITGVLDSGTKDAVIKFQRMHADLKADGLPGNLTLAELFPEQHKGRAVFENSTFPEGKYPHEKDVKNFFGAPATSQKLIQLPYAMQIAWEPDRTINRFYCHEKVANDLKEIFSQTLNFYGLDDLKKLRLNYFGGCLNNRLMRGGTRKSMHAYGIAVDLDPAFNQWKWGADKAHFARPEYKPFWDIVYKNHAFSMGMEKGFDWMHFQFARVK